MTRINWEFKRVLGYIIGLYYTYYWISSLKLEDQDPANYISRQFQQITQGGCDYRKLINKRLILIPTRSFPRSVLNTVLWHWRLKQRIKTKYKPKYKMFNSVCIPSISHVKDTPTMMLYSAPIFTVKSKKVNFSVRPIL